MDLFFSEVFGVSKDALEAAGALDITFVGDLPLFVDPFLLFNSDNPDYRQLHANILRYLRRLKELAAQPGVPAGVVSALFRFKEVKQTWLGYSQTGNVGSGLGADFAEALLRGLTSIFANFGSEKITRAAHLEKLCLIGPGVGRDRISDFTTNLIKGFLAKYTEEFCKSHVRVSDCRKVAVSKAVFNYETNTWEPRQFVLPFFGKDFVLLTPKNILTRDDTWINRRDLLEDLQDVVESCENEQLRDQLNAYLFSKLSADPGKDETRAACSGFLAEHPEVVDYYIRFKEDHGDEAVSRSSAEVSFVQRVFIDEARSLVARLEHETLFYSTSRKTYAEAHQRLAFLKDVIENKGGHRIFWDGSEPIRREQDVHILYRLVWIGTKADVSREVNDGRGPVDFKVSLGAADKTLVEFKLASNSKLKQNLASQTDVYEKASDAPVSIKAIFFFTEAQLARVNGILGQLNLTGSKDVVLIDARRDNKPSGSLA